MSLYADLGVDEAADRAALARAHRAAVKRHHPDTGGDRDKFERVQRAWLVLRDPERRARYDETGSVDDDPENDLSQLTGILINAFDKAMSQAGPLLEHMDVIASAIRILRGDAEAGRQNIGKARDLAKQVAAARKRLRFKGTGPDLIGRVLEERSRDIDAKIAQMEAAAAAMDRAAEHLRLYGWDFEAMSVERTLAAWTATSTEWR